MKVLYISNRLNSGDGSSVHGREFIKAATLLGHEVRSYPVLEEMQYDSNYKKSEKNSLLEILKKINFRNINIRLKNQSIHYRDFSNMLEGYIKSRSSVRELEGIIVDFSPDIIVYRAVMYDFIPNMLRKKFAKHMIAEVNSIKSLEQLFNRSKFNTSIAEKCEVLTHDVSDAIVVVSNVIKDHLLKTGVKQPITVASNGVDLSVFKPNEEVKKILKKQYAIDDKVVIGYVGSYKKWHGLSDSLEVLQEVLCKTPNVQFVVIGSGREEKRFHDQIMERGLEAHVTKIPSLPHNEISHYVSMIDIALMTYPPIENFYFSPLKMYEYLAAGIPVVASRLGQIEEVLHNNEIGELAAPGDTKTFAKIIEKLASDEQYRSRLGQNARTWAEQNCSWKANAEKVLAAADTCE